MVLITIVTGVYKPIYNWGATHCTDNIPIIPAKIRWFQWKFMGFRGIWLEKLLWDMS
jgi:hypothetical protein